MLFLLSAILLIPSCGQQKASTSTQKPNPVVATTPGKNTETAQQAKRTIELQPKQEKTEENPPPIPRTVSDTSGRFALDPQQRIVPRDFKIGPLQDVLTGQLNKIKAATTVKEFLTALGKKTIRRELIKPDMQTELERSLSYPLKQGLVPDDFRIGQAIEDKDQEMSVNVRLFKGKNTAEGEIYLVKNKDQWLIDDLQIGLTLLAEKPSKSTEPFSPSSYKWLLKDYLE
jgi:hypothetical protein